MSISFSCKKCGKKLKAPDHAAGKSSKCPGCGAPVTCPQPVYDAEAVESENDMPEILDDAIDPYGDVGVGAGAGGETNPYAVNEPAERRRPCPMCGEMILATAVKCRFCGEVFDETVKSGKKKKKSKKDVLTPSDWAIGVLAVVANLVMAVLAVSQGNPKANKMLIMAICSNLYWLVTLIVIHSLP